MIILLGLGLRQCRPREMEPQPAQRLGLVAVFDAREAGDDDTLCRTYEAQFEAAVAGLIHQRPVMRDVLGFFGEALDPHRALHPVRSGDDTEANLLWCVGWSSAVRSSRRPFRALLRMRSFLDAIDGIPHAEEGPKGRVSKPEHCRCTVSAPARGLFGSLRAFLGARLRARLDRVVRTRRLGDQTGIAEKARHAVGRQCTDA